MTTEHSGEVWTRITGFPDYAVSSDGRVMNISTGDVMTPSPAETGYLKIQLKGHRTKKVARLVALHHVPNPDGKPEVNHKDRIKYNNTASNLEWATRRENISHWKAWEQAERQFQDIAF